MSKLAPQPSASHAAALPLVAPATALPFAEVFHAHAGYVLGLLQHLGVRDADIEDVAQEVFVVVHAQLAAFEGRSSLKTWICGISLRKASEYRRKAYRRRERLTDGLEGARAALPSDQEETIEQSRVAERLKRALASLSEKQLQVFVLFEIEELSMAEISEALACPRFTAYTRLYAARRAVRAFFAAEARKEWGR